MASTLYCSCPAPSIGRCVVCLYTICEDCGAKDAHDEAYCVAHLKCGYWRNLP